MRAAQEQCDARLKAADEALAQLRAQLAQRDADLVAKRGAIAELERAIADGQAAAMRQAEEHRSECASRERERLQAEADLRRSHEAEKLGLAADARLKMEQLVSEHAQLAAELSQHIAQLQEEYVPDPVVPPASSARGSTKSSPGSNKSTPCAAVPPASSCLSTPLGLSRRLNVPSMTWSA